MRVRVLLLFALAGTDFRPVGSVKALCNTMSTVHGVARLFARRRGAGERLNARQVVQKNLFGEAHANNLGIKTNYD